MIKIVTKEIQMWNYLTPKRAISGDLGVLICVLVIVFFGMVRTNDVVEARRAIQTGEIYSWSKQDLTDRFGPGAGEEYFADWDESFYLGSDESYMRIDSSWLVVDWGSDGTVIRAAVLVD